MTIVTVDMQNPQPKDFLSVSQPKLLLINQQLDEQFGVDHVNFSDASANKGKHNKVTFVQQPDDPETIANEYCLFTKDTDGQPEIWARPPDNATAYQITKDGALYLGSGAFAAVNFDSTGAIQGNALNVSSVTVLGTASYRINFTTASTDNNYFYTTNTISTVDSSVGNFFNPLTTSISVTYQGNLGPVLPARAVVLIWRFQ